MPKLNVDEQKSLYEPIEIVLEGKAYVIEKVTTEMVEEVTNAGETNDVTTISKQLSIFLKEKPEAFKNIDLRKLGAVIRFISETITKQLEGHEEKNALKAGEKK
ncbi:hypothetical protein ES705_49345 [subsurface metagenome]